MASLLRGFNVLRATGAVLRSNVGRVGLIEASLNRDQQCRASTNEAEAVTEELVPERFYSKINIQVKGMDHAVLESYCHYVITAGKALDIDIGGRVALPTRTQKFTVLKSAHIYKKHRVQYEIRTHARLMQVKKITGTTADIFLEYIQRNLPEGVSMNVYQEQLDMLPSLLMAKQEENTKSDNKKTK